MEKHPISLGKHFWGLVASLITLLVGGWLMLAPYALGYQPSGAAWVNQTVLDFWTGLGVVVISLLSLAAFTVSLLGDLRRAGVIQARRRSEPVQAPAPTAIPVTGPTEGDFERAMSALASALAADLAGRRQAGEPNEPEPPEQSKESRQP